VLEASSLNFETRSPPALV